MATLTRYPKSTFAVGELSEPWRLELTLGSAAQRLLDSAANDIKQHGHVLHVSDCDSLYADALCSAIEVNVELIRNGTLPLPSARSLQDYPELRDV